MASATHEPLLDHIVILIPYEFLSSPPDWFASLFTFYPGGRHADGLTENTLALLADGSYIEFIAFVPGINQAKRERHRWGRKKEGSIIDWALTLHGRSNNGLEDETRNFKEIQKQVQNTGTGITYSDLVRGGRHRPDGEELRWAVAAAEDGEHRPLEPGLLPFWCLDDTKRDLRVPYKNSTHPSGTVGIAVISTTPDQHDQAAELDKVYDALLGLNNPTDDSIWELKTLDGDKVHDGGQVRLESVADTLSLTLTFFTTSNNFVGKVIGGEVAGGRLEFEFVAAR